MKKKDRIVVWPVYFDLNKTRLQGRRVTRRLAVASPRLEEVKRAAEGIGLRAEIVLDAKYPKRPWQKMGYILVSGEASKNETLRRIAEKLVSLRGQRQI
jgi:signal recognition particle subunit SRP19